MFESSVFINCPFDDSYTTLLRPMIFTIVSLGFNPKICTEFSDAGTNRLDKIKKLIEGAKFSIHDLSRLKSDTAGEFARMNMPFELGLDFGCKNFSKQKNHTKKKYLILGDHKYDYMKALSDISGIDINCHGSDVKKIIEIVRNWFFVNEKELATIALLTQTKNGKSIIKPTNIYAHFITFDADLFETLTKEGLTKEEMLKMPIHEQIEYMKNYVNGINNCSKVS